MDGNLFIVESPFQLLSAIEAVHYFDIKTPDLVIKYTPFAKNDEQMDLLVPLVKWKSVKTFRTFGYISLNEIFIVPHIVRLRILGKKYERIFVGQPRSGVMQLFAANLPCKQFLLMDDGNMSLLVQKELAEGKKLHELTISNKKFDVLKKIYYKLLFTKHRYSRLPDWFTCLDIAAIGNQQVIKHQFGFVRKQLAIPGAVVENTVYFIGSPLSEAVVLTEVQEMEFLRQAFETYRALGQSITYCIHRRESDEKLQSITKLGFDVTFRRAELPLELDLINERVRVHSLGAFYSTALVTVCKIFAPPEIRVFRIPDASINIAMREGVIEAYNSFADLGTLIKLQAP